MRKFVFGSGILALVITASWIDFFPVRCDVCRGILFRTDFAAILFGGHGSVIHWNCLPSIVDNTPDEMRQSRPSPVSLSLPLPVEGATRRDTPDLPG